MANIIGNALSAVSLFSALKGSSSKGPQGKYANFLSEIRKSSFARTSYFEVGISPPKILTGDKQFNTLHLYADSVNLPGLMLATSETRRYGFGPIEKKPYAPIFSDITVSFLVDGQGEIYKFFYKWLNGIVSSDNQIGSISTSQNGLAPFEVEFKDDYKCQLTISTFDEAGNSVLNSHLIDAIPIGITDAPLSWGDTDQVMKMQVTFTYFQHVLKTDKNEPVSGGQKPLSGLQQIVKASSAVQVLASLKKPQSIGDVVNVVNNAKVVLGGLGF